MTKDKIIYYPWYLPIGNKLVGVFRVIKGNYPQRFCLTSNRWVEDDYLNHLEMKGEISSSMEISESEAIKLIERLTKKC